jgi:hypothetical protein
MRVLNLRSSRLWMSSFVPIQNNGLTYSYAYFSDFRFTKSKQEDKIF